MRKDLPLREGCVPACRACPHRMWDAEASAAQKQQFLAEKLAPWREVLEPLRQPEEERRWHYRSRVRLSANWLHNRWAVGMEPRGDFIALPNCPVHEPWLNQWLATLMACLPAPADFPLRYVVQSGAMTTLIVKSPPARVGRIVANLAPLLAGLPRPPEVEALWVHAHPAAGRRLFAKIGWFNAFGSEWVRDDLGLWHGATAFQQALPELWRESLGAAENWLRPAAGDAVVDLYCGAGGSLARWLECGAAALGVESSGEAVAAALRNAPGAAVLQGHCAQRLPQVRAWHREVPAARRLAYLNPPRAGLESEVVEWLVREYRPRRLAYLSCSAATLARDLTALVQGGWRVARLLPYDFFPQTLHVETLALLEFTCGQED